MKKKMNLNSHSNECHAVIIIRSRKVSSWTGLGSELLPVVSSYLEIYREVAETVPQPQGSAAQVVQGTPPLQEWASPIPSLVPPSCYSLTGYVDEWVYSNPTFFSDVLNYNILGRGTLVPSSCFPAASGSGTSLIPPAVNPVLEPPAAQINPDIEPLNIAALPAISQDELFEAMQNSKIDRIHFNISYLYGSNETVIPSFSEVSYIMTKKDSILVELQNIDGPVNGQILWRDCDDPIRNLRCGKEYHPNTLNKILLNLRRHGRDSEYYTRFLNQRIHTIKNDDFVKLQLSDLPIDKLDYWSYAKVLFPN